MPRPTANPDLITSPYTRVSGTGEAAIRANKPLRYRMQQPNPRSPLCFAPSQPPPSSP
jgi:hypothetical protein